MSASEHIIARQSLPPALQRLHSFLSQPLRVSVRDGRVILGTLAGTDKLLNLILLNAQEYIKIGDTGEPDGRYVGQVMVPWRFVRKVEAVGQGKAAGTFGEL